MGKIIVFIFLFATSLAGEPFVSFLRFSFFTDNWETSVGYQINIDTDVITFYCTLDGFRPIKKSYEKLPYFHKIVLRTDQDHARINHDKIGTSHYHYKFIKKVDREILEKFLVFINAPENQIEFVAQDFDDYLLNIENRNSYDYSYNYRVVKL